MVRGSREKKLDLVDFLYFLSLLIAYWVWTKSGSYKLGIISFIVMLVILVIGIQLYKSWREQKLLDSGIDVVDNMSGIEFEEFLLAYFKKLGYTGYLTPPTEDYGADLVLEKNGRKLVVQAKRWKQIVGIEAVQQIVGAIRHYDAYKGMVITNNAFTENAHNLANSNGIELWDRQILTNVMYKSKSINLVNAVTTGNVNDEAMGEVAATLEEICPQCGKSLVLRNGKSGELWGCSGFPGCRFSKDV